MNGLAWIYLVLAGCTEIVWALGLKYAEGFTNPIPSIITVIFIIISFFLFAKAAMHVPIGTAYAVFTGIGAAGTAVAGIILFNEEAGVIKIGFLVLLITGLVGLKLTDAEKPEEGEEPWRGSS
ncbi:DMT family transporter [Planococcus lenghuensis]|uniref:Ligand-binding protein SH3 n=1 Tax=Planococcus lenghuensis TaxID=2213202 RepID=A0A1Q2KWS9_9BACL|nr:multidrug efflux SMR transporter [Planococcus lenghuensis]AQQ52132.1 ligand-binding protein SH3 [Planococcus lenghuensis]